MRVVKLVVARRAGLTLGQPAGRNQCDQQRSGAPVVSLHVRTSPTPNGHMRMSVPMEMVVPLWPEV